MRLTKTQDADYGISYFSKEINHGDFPFRFCLRVQYTAEWGDDAEKQYGKYHVELLAVSPTAVREAGNLAGALSSYGMAEEQFNALPWQGQYEIVMEYGSAAHLWQSSGNNLAKLLANGRKQLREADFLFGFAMDRAQNAIGDTGWDWIRGDIGKAFRQAE